jgi:DNA repair protein RadC
MATQFNLTPVYKTTLVRETSIKTRPQVSGSERAREVAMSLLGNSPNEQLIAIALDLKSRVIGAYVITSGTIDASLVHPREAFRAAILLNAASIVIAHNHPSGDLTPSRQDWAVYEQMKKAGELLGIAIHDSIIVSDTDSLSMAEECLHA